MEAWEAYKQNAWGHDSLSPVTNKAHNNQFGASSARTLISTMSTLWVMGMKDEFNVARNWIQEKFNISQIDHSMNVGDLVTNYIGGLLSCYALTKDQLFLDKALEIARIIKPAYVHGL